MSAPERIWAPVASWGGRYEVSSDGLLRKSECKTLVGQWLSDQGYSLARLSQPRKMVRVHRLVAECFCKKPTGMNVVNHKNHVRSDNRAANLEWTTQAQNLEHMAAHGRRRGHPKGKRSPRAKLTDEQVMSIRDLRVNHGISFAKIALLIGCSKRTAQRVARGEHYANLPLPTPPEAD